jgi:HTH-type transcriptional regulator, transcriptional repressor of NAD biosynthesis genes
MGAGGGTDTPSPIPTGLIIGRFNPPHLGHSFMIERAAAQCERLVVFVNTRDGELVPGELRAGWLAELHPDVSVIEVRHDLDNDFADQGLWAKWMTLLRSRWPHEIGPHAVFSSDPYVDELARRFGADAVIVDADRVNVPISATQVRAAPADHLDRLAPAVRAWVEANLLER